MAKPWNPNNPSKAGYGPEEYLQRRQRAAAATEQGSSPLDVQTGGDHYKKLKVQPAFYNWANRIPFIEGCCIKYLTRWRDKGGVEDLLKSKHLHELLIYFETTPIVLIEQSKIKELERACEQVQADFGDSDREAT